MLFVLHLSPVMSRPVPHTFLRTPQSDCLTGPNAGIWDLHWCCSLPLGFRPHRCRLFASARLCKCRFAVVCSSVSTRSCFAGDSGDGVVIGDRLGFVYVFRICVMLVEVSNTKESRGSWFFCARKAPAGIRDYTRRAFRDSWKCPLVPKL